MDVYKLLQISLEKVTQCQRCRCGPSLRKNLLIAGVMNRARQDILRGHASVHVDSIPRDDEPEQMDYDETSVVAATQVDEASPSNNSNTPSPPQLDAESRALVPTTRAHEEMAEEEVLINKEVMVSHSPRKRSYEYDDQDEKMSSSKLRCDEEIADEDEEETKIPFLVGPFALDVKRSDYGHYLDSSIKTRSAVEPLWRTAILV